MRQLDFVLPEGSNVFFAELVSALQAELETLGVASSLTLGPFPERRDGHVPVLVAPHEHLFLGGWDAIPADSELASMVVISTEQPGSLFFDAGVSISRVAGAIFDVSPLAVEHLRRAGVAARHLQLGYTGGWDHFDPEGERDIDVLFLGNGSPRRLAALAGYATTLAGRRCLLQVSDPSRPSTGDSPSFAAERKWELMARSKVLLNVHAADRPYFESLRVTQAMHCGAVVVSEHAASIAPFVPGSHLFMGHLDSLATIADALLRDEPRGDRARADALELLRSSMPLSHAVSELANTAEQLARAPRSSQGSTIRSLGEPGATEPPAVSEPDPSNEADDEAETIQAAVKELRLDLIELRREYAMLMRDANGGGEPPISVEVNAAWRGHPGPAVTVVTALYNHSDLIEATLESVARNRMQDVELIVVDDGSDDASGAVARAWIARHPERPAALVTHAVNRGLGAARNTAIDFSRGRYCFVLDSDNEIYPRCLEVLAAALDRESEAAFAFPLIEVFGDLDAYAEVGGAPLLNIRGWDPLNLPLGNFIDAMAMVRTSTLRALGGYTTDRRLYGFEDWDLWCRIADAGDHGHLERQILARYRATATSMQTVSRISLASAQDAIAERSPSLLEASRLKAT